MDIWTAQKIILLGFLLKGVWCRYFSISLPQNIQALSGSCVIIKCRFEIREKYDKDLTERATGLWFKDGTDLNNNLVFNSSTSSQNSFMKGNITGKLKDKDCTTVFHELRSDHSGQYYFRIEGEGELKWTYSETSVSIHVIDSPTKPTVQLYVEQKEVQDQEEVLEGRSVSLRCSAETLCSSPPPTLTWSSTPRIPLSESSRLEELISDLNFTATHRQHRVTFTCTITYQLQDKNKTAQTNITLHVQYSPKNTSVSVLPSSSVLEGSSVTLTCSSDANPAVNYTWSRESEGQMEQLQTGDTLTFARIHLKHRGWYYCTAQNQHGTQNSSVMLNIQYAPKNTSVSVSTSSSVLEGGSVTLTCSSDANPAVNYTWSRESEGQMEQLQTGDTLTFDRIDLKHRGWYYCTAQNQHGTQNSSVMLNIQYAPKISPSSNCTRTDVTVCFCEADGNPSPELEWHLSGCPVTNSSNMFISEERLSSTGLRSSITLNQSLTHTSTLQCVSNNTHGTASHRFNLLHSTPQVSGFHHFSFLVGVAGGASVMMIICGISLICARRESNTRRDDGIELILADRENECANNAMLSPTGSVTQNHEELHYTSIDFTNTQPESEEIRGISSLTTDYAVVQHYPGGVSEAESSTGGDQPNSRIAAVVMSEKNQTVQEQEAKMGEVFSQQSEDTTYENINI
uniref:Ig-like domain-containing protein n=1 Tax=Cyprinus carpio TaxID=7962 RepID=A0A8C1MEP2_CYPCA